MKETREQMKYMLMMNAPKAGFATYREWSEQDIEAHSAVMRDVSRELNEAGELVLTQGLAWPEQAKLVRAGSDGQPDTDGVFPESKEFLAGFWIVDVESAERAYQIASRISGAPGPGGVPTAMPIEVRQVMSSRSEAVNQEVG